MTLNLELPATANLNEHELKISLAAKLYERGKLTLGQAAKLVGLSKRTFIEMLGIYGVSVFSTSVDDLLSDIQHA